MKRSHPTVSLSFLTVLHRTLSVNVPRQSGQFLSKRTTLFPFTFLHSNFFLPKRNPILSHVFLTTRLVQLLSVPVEETVIFSRPKTWGTSWHLLLGTPKSHDGQHSLGRVTTGLPKQSFLVRRKQSMMKQNLRLSSLSHRHLIHGVSAHWTTPLGRKLTQPLNLQLLCSHEGQHCPFGVTGLAQRGLAHRTALQSIPVASICCMKIASKTRENMVG